jgi:hypothetical protein
MNLTQIKLYVLEVTKIVFYVILALILVDYLFSGKLDFYPRFLALVKTLGTSGVSPIEAIVLLIAIYSFRK